MFGVDNIFARSWDLRRYQVIHVLIPWRNVPGYIDTSWFPTTFLTPLIVLRFCQRIQSVSSPSSWLELSPIFKLPSTVTNIIIWYWKIFDWTVQDKSTISVNICNFQIFKSMNFIKKDNWIISILDINIIQEGPHDQN